MLAMRPTLALLAILLLAGCYTKYDLTGADWTKPNTTPNAMIQQTTQDEMECVREAREAGSTPDLYVGGLVDASRIAIEEAQRSGSYKRCMTSRGYQPSN
jgi:hypothetical protein